MNEPIPSIKALLVCDSIAQEIGSGKRSILGLFDKILAGSVPCVHQQLAVYFSAIDAEGSYKFSLDLVVVNTEHVISRGEISIDAPNRLEPIEGAIILQGLNFPEAGKYEFRLYANGAFLESKEITISLPA
jgi:hypothetical protein